MDIDLNKHFTKAQLSILELPASAYFADVFKEFKGVSAFDDDYGQRVKKFAENLGDKIGAFCKENKIRAVVADKFNAHSINLCIDTNLPLINSRIEIVCEEAEWGKIFDAIDEILGEDVFTDKFLQKYSESVFNGLMIKGPWENILVFAHAHLEPRPYPSFTKPGCP